MTPSAPWRGRAGRPPASAASSPPSTSSCAITPAHPMAPPRLPTTWTSTRAMSSPWQPCSTAGCEPPWSTTARRQRASLTVPAPTAGARSWSATRPQPAAMTAAATRPRRARLAWSSTSARRVEPWPWRARCWSTHGSSRIWIRSPRTSRAWRSRGADACGRPAAASCARPRPSGRSACSPSATAASSSSPSQSAPPRPRSTPAPASSGPPPECRRPIRRATG